MRRQEQATPDRQPHPRSSRRDDEAFDPRPSLSRERTKRRRGDCALEPGRHANRGLSNGECSDSARVRQLQPMPPPPLGKDLLRIDGVERGPGEILESLTVGHGPDSIRRLRYPWAVGRRIFAWFVLGLGSLTLCCAPRRPASIPRQPARNFSTEAGVSRLGGSWLRTRDGILEARFAGSPYERGYARGRLAYSEIVEGERSLESLLHDMIRSPIRRFILRRVIALNLRASLRDMSVAHQEEIAGLADAEVPDPLPRDWPPFARQLALHALHDFSQRYIDAVPLGACSGFLASGPATSDGHTLLARNFDFEGGGIWDREKIVAYVVPRNGLPYLSVTFGGLTGVTSGFNAEGIGVVLQAITGGPTASSGEPATLVAADVLEQSRSLDEAIKIVQKARVFVSDLYLLADGKTGALAVVEKTPRHVAIRRGGSLLLATNQAETPELALDLPVPASSTSAYRRKRLAEILGPLAGRLDVPVAVAVLRDRRGLGGRDIGPGNRNAIDALIAAHSVVFDLTAGTAWVAAAPHGLGPFVPFSLPLGASADPADPRFAALDSASIPADRFLTDGRYASYLAARGLLLRGRRAFEQRRYAEAAEEAARALARAPGFVEALALRAESRGASGDRGGAIADSADALARDPAPPPFAREIARLHESLLRGAFPPGTALTFPISVSDWLP
jgi:isopenicillin-N N-acyltransferase like protein